MYVAINNVNGMQEISLDALLSSYRVVWLTGEITNQAAVSFAKQVMYYALADPTQPIKVFLQSEGGDIDAGMMIYDIIQSAVAPIEMNCVGNAYSMAAILLACGKHGRYILPHGKVMLHEPLIAGEIGGKSSSIRTLSETLLKIKRDIDALIARHTGQAPKKIAAITHRDCFFTAAEAVQFGLADNVRSYAEMLPTPGGN